jgi:hypothetical protein
MILVYGARGHPDAYEPNDVGGPIGERMESVGFHANRADHPAINELGRRHPPIQQEDINKNTSNFLKSVLGVHSQVASLPHDLPLEIL